MTMTLGEILDRLSQRDKGLDIYAKRPWTPDSTAVFERAVDDTTRPLGDMEYMIDVYSALDVIEAWSFHRDGALPTTAQRCMAVAYYADHDTYLDPDDDADGA